MVSIVLPTYNGEKYLNESIQSILDQTYENFELIIVDDCSTDSTPTILDRFQKIDERIQVYRNTKNKKLPASLNYGFSKSHGKYLTWTSDDNIFEKDAVLNMVRVLESNPNIGLVFSKMEYIDENSQSFNEFSETVDSLNEIKYKNIVGACFLYTREVYKTIGEYNVERFLVEDYDYWLRISRHFDIFYLNKILYKYRKHKNSLTESRNMEMLKAKIELLEEELQFENFTGDTEAQIYNVLAEAYFSIDDFKKMKQYIRYVKKNSFSNEKILNYKLRIAFYLPVIQIKVIKSIFCRLNKKRM